ncbi:MAG: glycosyltransferase [Paludibacteraceae bacterium]|nr:glycosyltransferase [Paludibacteraceae bacterium]
MMSEWLNIPMWEYVLAGVLAVLFIYQVYFYARYIGKVGRGKGACAAQPEATPATADMPGVSVIVSARNEEDNLTNYLQQLLEQDYPKFEVIVVNDGSEDRTQMVLEEYRLKYTNLHVTFVPTEARVTSSKKLALTLAVKAANYEYLLLTDADCVPESNQWIKCMMAPIADKNEKQIVLGYSPYFPEKTAVNEVIRFDTLFTGLHYMGRAMAGHPYMGVGRNMLYRRSMFMAQKGFAGLLMMRSGDDDLFVNKVATHKNVAVSCSPDALCWSVPKRTYTEWLMQKRRHLSVSPHYKQSTRMMLGIEPLTRGLWYMALIVCFVWGTAWLSLVAWVLFVVRLLMQVGIMNHTARKLGEQTFGLEVLWYDMCLPVLTAYLLSTQPKHPAKW